ncbi:hypothetical protein ACFRAO_02510 [Streptomyces sp. NPDC056656]|uniref:hypothetical protein n=1 Tax=Streptomyces sp. NPDC056656 TaxID=3345895 RepID=UPI003678FE21
MDTPAGEPITRRGPFWLRAALLAALGVTIVAFLGTCLLGIAHSPQPHEVPVGFVGPAAQEQQLAHKGGDALEVRPYEARAAALRHIEKLDVYGALVVTPQGNEFLKSTAASPQVAATLTTLFAQSGARVTDIKPLPSDDSAGGSIAVLVQLAVLAGTIGAVGLGQLVPRYRANVAAGELPLPFTVVYSLCVGMLASGFGVGAGTGFWAKSLALGVITLAVCASVSALVSVIGIAGSAVGGVLFFLLGVPASGAATAVPMLPGGWAALGQALPPGAGATLLRKVFCFHDASISHQLLVSALYAGIGLLTLGYVNAFAGAHRRRSLTGLP